MRIFDLLRPDAVWSPGWHTGVVMLGIWLSPRMWTNAEPSVWLSVGGVDVIEVWTTTDVELAQPEDLGYWMMTLLLQVPGENVLVPVFPPPRGVFVFHPPVWLSAEAAS